MKFVEKVIKKIEKRPRTTIIIWLIILLALASFVPDLFTNTKLGIEAPEGTDAYDAEMLLKEEFPSADSTAHIIVIQRSDGEPVICEGVRNFTFNLLASVNQSSQLAERVTEIAGFYIVNGTLFESTQWQFVNEEQDTTIIAIFTLGGSESDWPTKLSEELKVIIDDIKPDDLKIYLTGMGALQNDMQANATQDIQHMDMIVIPLVAIFLWYLLRSWRLVFLPFLGILVSLIITFGIIAQVANYMTIMTIVPALMMVIGMGIGVDYALFMLSRFREERLKGHSNSESVHAMMKYAGHTIAVSGLTLTVAIFGLIIFPIEIIQGIAIGVTVTVLITLPVNLILLPAILFAWGEKFLPSDTRKEKQVLKKKQNRPHKQSFWKRVGYFSSDHAVPIIVIALLIAVPTSYFALTMTQSMSLNDFAAEGTEGRDGLMIIEEKFGPGMIAVTNIVIDTNVPGGAMTEQYFNATQEFAVALIDTGVIDPSGIRSHTYANGIPVNFQFATAALDGSSPLYNTTNALLYRMSLTKFVSPNATAGFMGVMLNIDPTSEEAQEWIEHVRDDIIPSIDGLGSYEIGIAGTTAQVTDLNNQVLFYFPFVILFVLVVIYIVIGLMYKSVFLPLRLLATILLTLSWVYAASVLIFEHHWGEIFMPAIGDVSSLFFIMPIICFSIIIGLGMDYDLFIISRIREGAWEGMCNRDAIAHGLETTGVLVTGAACIMAVAFGGLLLAHSMVLVEFGFMLAVAVLIDAFVVRTLLVPAIMSLAKRYNWWPSKPPQNE
jgi:RND superfamily putative drug exporter